MATDKQYQQVYRHARPRLTKVQRLLASCGYYATARYLAKRGYTLAQALAIMNFPARAGIN